jgi:hypothetical protein
MYDQTGSVRESIYQAALTSLTPGNAFGRPFLSVKKQLVLSLTGQVALPLVLT